MRASKFSVRLLATFFIFALFVSFSPHARAEAWGTNIAAAILKQQLEKIMRQIEGAMLGALKASAIQQLSAQVGNLVGGTSTGNSLVISDFREFLYEEPEEAVQLYMEDFFSQMTKGRASSTNYESPYSWTGDMRLGSYSARLAETAKYSLATPYQPTDIEEISPDVETALDEGDLRTFNAYFSNPMNNPYGFTLAAQSYQQSVREMEQQKKVVEAVSHGYRSSPGLPGATVGNIVANTNDIGNKIIAAASNPAELASGVIMALVNKMITKTIQKGIGEVKSNISREIRNVDRQITTQVNTLDDYLGPAVEYIPEIKQQTDVNLPPSTDPGQSIPQTVRI